MAVDRDTDPVTEADEETGTCVAANRGRVGRLSIGVLMALLIAVTIIPPLVFSLILLNRNNLAQQEMVSTLAEATAGSIIETVDRQLQGMLSALRVLSMAGAIDESELEEFHRRAEAALADSGSHLIVLDTQMNQILNTRVPFGESLGRTSDPETAMQALETGKPAISDGFFGQTAQRWVFNVILPWLAESRPSRLLVMTQNAETLSGTLTRQNLRGGWNAALVDRKGIVLASTFISSDIGNPFFLDGLYSVDGPVRGTVRYEGESYETITKRSDLSGWQAVVWAPSAIVQAPMTRALRTLAIGGVAMMAVGAIAAWLLGRQISKPVRRLAQDARRLGAGENVTGDDYPVAEIATVSAALAQAAEDRRAAENEIRFLMREVAHRSKNQLTVVSSIAKQSARNARSFAAFQDSFQKRIQGLARSTDLLIAGGVAGIELHQLVDAQVEPFRPSDETRFRMQGPAFRLSHQAAQTLGLALHELATNAAKYGAFQTPSGRLTVNWKRSGDNLEIVWREHVPRLRRRPESRGFGTEVIERMLGGALDAQIERIFHRDGLECRFVMPLARLQPEPVVALHDAE